MLRRLMFLMLAMAITAGPAMAVEKVLIKTNLGEIKLELYEDKAPQTVKNFLRYVDEGFYAGTVFHRVMKNFMIQGGGFDTDLKKKPAHEPVKNEADNGLKNDRGTIAMARTSVVDSATAQFFINHANNDFLNFTAPTSRGYGYAVFGRVIEGMEVVDRIAASPTKATNRLFQNLPTHTVVIEGVQRLAK